jgi:DNA-binding Lrp family transcriptional regulator
MKLDDVDVKILEHLQKDARLSFRDLAKKVGVSTPTVSAKVKILESLGLIKGYSAIIDASLLNETLICFVIRAKPSDLEGISKRLKKLGQVRSVYSTAESNLIVMAAISQSHKLGDLIAKLKEVSEIESYDTYHIVDVLKEEPDALLSKGLAVSLSCFYCKKHIHEEPVVLKLDGRDHYMCCKTCAREYKKKYMRIKSKS